MINAQGKRSIAAEVLSGTAITGDIHGGLQIHALPLEFIRPPQEVPAPTGLNNVPLRVNPFIGRKVALDSLDKTVAHSEGAVVHVVHGLGGVGKSTVAAHWAASRASRYSVVWWITADTQGALSMGLAGLAAALQPGIDQAMPQAALAERAIQWLSSHHNWLLVLDDVTDPVHVQPLLARATSGHCVITSRRATGWHHIGTPARLDVMGQTEAVEMFTRILQHNDQRSADGVVDVCEELGYLPLGVEQAAAFCAETGTSPREYLEMLSGYPAETFRAAPEGREEERTIARVWHLSLNALADDPLPGRLLRILSWYAPETIPRTLLTGIAKPPILAKAIGRLAAHSMIAIGDSAANITLHRLVQAVGRTPDLLDPHRGAEAIEEARHDAISVLYQALPDNPQDSRNWARWHVLMPHVEAIATYSSPEADSVTLCDMLSQAGGFLNIHGRAVNAVKYLERAVNGHKRLLGDDNRSTLASRSNLVYSYHVLNGPARARPLAQRNLDDAERILGKEHPDTLTLLHNVAYMHMAEGDLEHATQLFKRALMGRERVLGPDHDDTLITKTNLARAYRDAGDHGRAVSLSEQILNDATRVFGKDHYRTMVSEANLGHAYEAAGDYARAILINRRALADSERVLGVDHPETLTARNNLATSYLGIGNLKRGLILLERTLADRERVLGADHPETLITKSNCAVGYLRIGKIKKARLLLIDTLKDCERVLGKKHPLTRSVRTLLPNIT
ncbi:tetratricopeptide repeat protein [Nonomuraea sp. FMUSA5-5]|uniref:Tetratricopeptide repeat protein n=1 Tax=Nonomuraea composti TaxID=2720023 RepID=A0ABX1BPF1_9ACTN|nr:tetratricopeptide repeat protein [Nonomuraea sp. FMUSA5-5]NJP96643.1 tetratricopeptide repeat protein [Nonomuraea sp. FMUSA5-5]